MKENSFNFSVGQALLII